MLKWQGIKHPTDNSPTTLDLQAGCWAVGRLLVYWVGTWVTQEIYGLE
jgi:hypothetical protein